MNRPLLALLTFLCFCCKDEGGMPPPPYKRTIEISLEDYGTSDAWLRVRFTDAPPYSFRLIRDGENVLTVVASPNDTLIADEQLLPNRSYVYKAYRISGTNVIDSSQAVQVTTLDTTSSAWQWALDTLGVMNSYLLDCAIIAPDNIWVVGELYRNDSLFSLSVWNGTTWTLRRVPVPLCPSGIGYFPLRAIYAFDANDIWMTGGGEMIRWDGQTFRGDCSVNSLLQGGLNRIWGSGSSIYAVGGSGTVVYSPDHGTTWQRQESGTTLALTDMFGATVNDMYAVGLHYGQSRGVVLKKAGPTWETMIEGEILTDTSQLFRTKLYGITEGVWVDERGIVYTVGNLMYQFKHGKWGYVTSLPENFIGGSNFVRGYLHDVQGNASNDMFIVGERNTIRHYNGNRWQQVGLPYSYTSPILWYRVAVEGNTAVAVGSILDSFGRGLVIRLWR